MAVSAMAFPTTLLANNVVSGYWRKMADLPFAVQEIYPAIQDGFIHVAGGFKLDEDGVNPTAAHVQYSIEKDEWRERAPLPEARHHPQLIACGDAIYALGGFKSGSAGGWAMQNQTWVYQRETDSWTLGTAAPEAHGESVCLAANGNIHVIGGRTPGGESNATWQDHVDSDRHLIFEISSGTWQRAAPALNPRNSAAGAIIDKGLYVVGGRTVSGGNTNLLEVYDPVEDKWRLAAPMPQAQGGLAAAEIDGQLVAFGGEYFGANGYGVYSNVWCYNPDKDSWSALTPMLTPRHGLGAVSDGKTIFAMGGATGVATNGTRAVMEMLNII